MPPNPGIDTSMTTTSGRKALVRATPSVPVVASPNHLEFSMVGEQLSQAFAHKAVIVRDHNRQRRRLFPSVRRGSLFHLGAVHPAPSIAGLDRTTEPVTAKTELRRGTGDTEVKRT
jgi:hypothetical protein